MPLVPSKWIKVDKWDNFQNSSLILFSFIFIFIFSFSFIFQNMKSLTEVAPRLLVIQIRIQAVCPQFSLIMSWWGSKLYWSYGNFPHIFSPFHQWDFFCNGVFSHHRWIGPLILCSLSLKTSAVMLDQQTFSNILILSLLFF